MWLHIPGGLKGIISLRKEVINIYRAYVLYLHMYPCKMATATTAQKANYAREIWRRYAYANL
jgi:hypothetical protein